ncbi:DUF1385 domain-containing protein [Vampirovibrio sp.]|uniref:DUF1385 domain-containing protein n=1 Tax=Vampirovibrio sp. TaxID=2717857 RepID=UPI0035947FEA
MLQSVHQPGNANGELSPRYQGLRVDVIAEVVPAVQGNIAMGQLRALLLNLDFVVLIGPKRKPLAVIGRGDLAHLWKQPDEARLQSFAEAWMPCQVSANETLQQVNYRFASCEQAMLPLVDAKGRYTGKCASLPRLIRLKSGTLRPPRVGGLATPLGVYMTSGHYMAGAGWPGLVAAGFLFGILAPFLDLLSVALFSVLVLVYPPVQILPVGEQTILQGGLLLACLLGLLRLTPLAGLHAAEHMTINAIEADLALTEPMVRTQPREHQRCGTNLVALLGGLQIAAISLFYANPRLSGLGLLLYATLWFWLVFSFWRPMGLWLQRHFTTKTPSWAQLASGIRAGHQLLERFTERPHGVPSFWRRLWGAGLLQMMTGFAAGFWLVDWLLAGLGWSSAF